MPKCKFFGKISTVLINMMIIIALMFEMTVCVWKGNEIFAFLFNIFYGTDETDKLLLLALALPYFLASITVLNPPLLIVVSILGLLCNSTLAIIEFIYFCVDMKKQNDIVLLGEAVFVPELVAALLMATGSFPVVSL